MKLTYDLNDRPSLSQTLIFAFQQMIAIMAATLLVPILMSGFAQGDGTTLSFDPAAALFGAGIGTLVYIFFTKKKSPVFLGSSFTFLGAYAAADIAAPDTVAGCDVTAHVAAFDTVICMDIAVDCSVLYDYAIRGVDIAHGAGKMQRCGLVLRLPLRFRVIHEPVADIAHRPKVIVIGPGQISDDRLGIRLGVRMRILPRRRLMRGCAAPEQLVNAYFKDIRQGGQQHDIGAALIALPFAYRLICHAHELGKPFLGQP